MTKVQVSSEPTGLFLQKRVPIPYVPVLIFLKSYLNCTIEGHYYGIVELIADYAWFPSNHPHRIFDSLQDDLVLYLFRLMIQIMIHLNRFARSNKRDARALSAAYMSNMTTEQESSSCNEIIISVGQLFFAILITPVRVVFQFAVILYLVAPVVGIILSSWRLRARDYGSNDGDNSKANLAPALDIFYALVLLQGAFYLFWYLNNMVVEEIILSVRRQCHLLPEDWGTFVVSKYHSDTRGSCTKEPTFVEDRNLITYAVGLLDSESRKEYHSGARLLATFIKQEKDVRSLLLLSRPKIQKLIDTLGWRGIPDDSREIRLLAAKIVADVAGNIHLAQFPGATQCITSLFEEDELSPRHSLPLPVSGNGRITEGRNQRKEEGDHEKSSINTEGGACNELVLQGLTILERLASNHHNCRDICSTPGLLPMVTAPIYSDTLIEDIKVIPCADVVHRSLKVVHQIIRAPGCSGRRLRHEICSNKLALSNLESILDPVNGACRELQMGAMEILTEMALDLSVNLANETKQNLIKKQLQIFFAGEGEEESATLLNPLKATAGRTLVLLSNKNKTNSLFVIREHHGNAARLTKVLDGETNIIYRTVAAEVLKNLCTHGTLPEEYVKETLLPKVLTKILCSKVEPQAEASVLQQPESSQRNISAGGYNNKGICGTASHGDDVENLLPEHNRQNEQPGQETEEQTITNELLEALLSLNLLVYDKMIGVDGFAAVFQAKAPGDKFVAKLKTIVEENCKATSSSLRIVKLCCQIAILMMERQHSQYTAHFKHLNFIKSVSDASKIMSNLESCVLITRTNCQMKKNVRPLLFHLEKKVLELVSS